MQVASLELCRELYGEEWKTIGGFPRYEVSSLGRIRHVDRKKIRKMWSNKNGYQSWAITITGKRVINLHLHQVVAKHFVSGGGGERNQVNHKDSDPGHNCAHNLEWVTPGENVEHSRRYGRANRYQNRGEKHGMHKLTTEQVRKIRQLQGVQSGIKTAKEYGVDDQTIYDIWNGRRWSHVV